ncbi:hypothetical protein FRC05_011552 [Tulasnella sp. 425]|nr:hypothetical protein FRC05_011552 [Tulasnella sp. 425]
MPGAWTNVSFFLDGTKQGEYIWEGTEANQLIYNITAFETLALTNSSHVLDIVGGQGPDIAMYLDYIQYTQLLPVTASSMMSSSSATQLSSSASITAIASTPTSSATPVTSSTPSALLGSLRPPGISIAGIVGIGMMVGVSVLLVANLAIWIHRRKKKATKRPRCKFHKDFSRIRQRTLKTWNSLPLASETALLKFHQDASLPRAGVHEASYSQLSQTGFEKASFEASYNPRGEYTPLQTPSASLVRGVHIR